MSTEKLEALVEQSIVLYTDGGANPNPGNIGWGVHGYLYENVLPKKGSGHPTHYPTAKGYIPKVDREKLKVAEVRPISYLDGFGSSLYTGTNNVAEVQATTFGLRKAREYAVKDVTIFTDSEYVRKGVHEWHPAWLRRNWFRTDGSPVPNASEWKLLLEEYNALLARGITVNVYYIKAHAGHPGNEDADQLATVGVLHSAKKLNQVEFKVTAAEGYWKSDVEKHPFVSNRRMYFNSAASSFVAGEYYLGEHGKDDDLLGKKISDGTFSVIQLKDKDIVLDTLRNYQAEVANGTDSIIMARLDKLYSPTVYRQMIDYGGAGLVRPNLMNLDLNCLDKEPLTRELRPARLAMRAVESLSTLKMLLERYKEKDADVATVDLTDKLYFIEETQKKDKVVKTLKLKPEYNVGFASLQVPFNAKAEKFDKDVTITITLGIDMLDRNALKRLESLEPKVTLIVWKEAPEVLRYATVIESLGSFGIWAGVYSNMIFIKPE